MWCHSLRDNAAPVVYQASPVVVQLDEQLGQKPQPLPNTPLIAVQHVEVEELPDPVGMYMPKPAPSTVWPMLTSRPNASPIARSVK